jgi:hypothetical protein
MQDVGSRAENAGAKGKCKTTDAMNQEVSEASKSLA